MRRQELHPRTAVINKTQKIQSKQAKYAALTWLAATFPQAFDNTVCIRPLKIGIMNDILAYADNLPDLPVSRSKIREAVVLFTRRIDYLICLKAREMRVDLEGNPVVAVTEEEAEKAALKIRKRVDKTVRNARKVAAGKIPAHYHVKPSPAKMSNYTPSYSATYQATNDLGSHHKERPLFSMQHSAAQPAKAAQVVVKHKTARQFDPDAVARLKERLGLSRKAQVEKETS